MSEHQEEWCDHCRVWMVICRTCGNNTCNAGYGTVNGEPCTDCPSAYETFERLQEKEMDR